MGFIASWLIGISMDIPALHLPSWGCHLTGRQSQGWDSVILGGTFSFLVLAIIFIIVIVAEPEIMLFSIASFYAASGPLGAVIKYFKGKTPEDKSPAAGAVPDPENGDFDDKNHQIP